MKILSKNTKQAIKSSLLHPNAPQYFRPTNRVYSRDEILSFCLSLRKKLSALKLFNIDINPRYEILPMFEHYYLLRAIRTNNPLILTNCIEMVYRN